MFVPSLGTTDVMLRVDALTNFTQQALQVPPCAAVRISKANLFCKTTFLICACSALRAEIGLDILTAVRAGTCAIIHTQCWTYIPDMSTVIHLTIHMKR